MFPIYFVVKRYKNVPDVYFACEENQMILAALAAAEDSAANFTWLYIIASRNQCCQRRLAVHYRLKEPVLPVLLGSTR